MNFNNEPVYVGDRVFDVSINKGYGEVIRVNKDSFEVKFPRFVLTYTENGFQTSKDRQTLYWDKPLVISPSKEENNWAIKRGMVADFFKLINEAKKVF